MPTYIIVGNQILQRHRPNATAIYLVHHNIQHHVLRTPSEGACAESSCGTSDLDAI